MDYSELSSATEFYVNWTCIVTFWLILHSSLHTFQNCVTAILIVRIEERLNAMRVERTS